MNDHYHKVAAAISYIQDNYQSQPGLDSIAARAGLSSYHFQRLFSRYVGVSPKRFLENFTVNKAKAVLRDSGSVLDAAYAVGLSSSSRLYDHFVTLEAMTPGEYKNAGRGLQINYGIHPGPFGSMLIAETGRGICWLSFITEAGREAAIREMQAHWPLSQFTEVESVTRATADKLFANKGAKFQLLVKGTNFQISVWRALLTIPGGHVVSYKSVAQAIHKPAAVRAVAGAVGANSIACLIPCHRVLRESGEPGGYRWGVSKKLSLLELEAARREQQ
ncbi:MAG: bifunctional transcriptional activator/DNA repair enzyme AdaA [Gammaproteobacteria bacterium]